MVLSSSMVMIASDAVSAMTHENSLRPLNLWLADIRRISGKLIYSFHARQLVARVFILLSAARAQLTIANRKSKIENVYVSGGQSFYSGGARAPRSNSERAAHRRRSRRRAGAASASAGRRHYAQQSSISRGGGLE